MRHEKKKLSRVNEPIKLVWSLCNVHPVMFAHHFSCVQYWYIAPTEHTHAQTQAGSGWHQSLPIILTTAKRDDILRTVSPLGTWVGGWVCVYCVSILNKKNSMCENVRVNRSKQIFWSKSYRLNLCSSAELLPWMLTPEWWKFDGA